MRRPWWLWLASASFVAYWIFLQSSLYYLREPVGAAAPFGERGAVVQTINPNSPADRGGMRVGDRIVTVSGFPLRDQIDSMVIGGNTPVGVATDWVVERDGQLTSLVLPPMLRHWTTPTPRYTVILFGQLTSLMLGLLLAWRGDGRPTTLLAAALLCSIGCTTLPLMPRSMAVTMRAMPIPLQALIWPAAVASISVPALMFALCAVLPQRLMPPRALALLLLPVVMVSAYVSFVMMTIVYSPLTATSLPLPQWLAIAGPLSYALYVLGGAVLLFVSLRRAPDQNTRRGSKC